MVDLVEQRRALVDLVVQSTTRAIYLYPERAPMAERLPLRSSIRGLARRVVHAWHRDRQRQRTEHGSSRATGKGGGWGGENRHFFAKKLRFPVGFPSTTRKGYRTKRDALIPRIWALSLLERALQTFCWAAVLAGTAQDANGARVACGQRGKWWQEDHGVGEREKDLAKVSQSCFAEIVHCCQKGYLCGEPCHDPCLCRRWFVSVSQS